MDRQRFNNCVRVLVALQCLELVWSYSILIDTLKNDQQIENSLSALIQSQESQPRLRRQAQDPQPNNTEPTGGSDLGTVQGQGQDGSAADPGSPGNVTGIQEAGASLGSADRQSSGVQADGSAVTSDPTDPNNLHVTGKQEPGASLGSADPQASGVQADGSAVTSALTDPISLHVNSSNVDQPIPEQGQEPSIILDQPQEGSQSDSGSSDSGNSDSGNSESGGSDSGNSDSGNSDGNSDSGNSESGNSESGNSDSGNSDSGNSDSGNSDSGNSESGNSESGNSGSGISESGHSDPSVPSDKSHGNQHNPVNKTREGEQPPRALAMTASDTGVAPIALAMTGGQGDLQQPYSSSQSDAVSLNQKRHVHTVPLVGQLQPMALPQRQPAPSGTYEPPISGKPMALPQQQANPNAGSTNQRPPPNWNKGNQGGGGASPSGGGGVNPAMNMGGMFPMGGGMFPMGGGNVPMVGGAVPGGMTMQQMNQMNMMRGQYEGIGDQMERQRKMYRRMYGFDPRYNPQFGGFNGTFPNMQNFTGNPYGNNPYNAYRYGDRPDYEGYPGYGLDIKTGFYPPCTNMSDPFCQQRMMAQREIQIETPYGELDMEPGEIDIEGIAAHGLLKRLGLGGPNMNPHMQEINLNRNVLNALKQRFGVNTTAGIQRMSSNPEFQAFMYRVLTHSAPMAPGEFNANLTQAEVNWIMNDLSASTTNHRLTTGNLDHAKLNRQNMTSPSGQRSSNTVLTINGGTNQNMANNPWAQMGMGVFPGLASAQTQGASQAAAQSGIVQALVQGMLGGEVVVTTVGPVTQGGVVWESAPSQKPVAQNNGTQTIGSSNTGAAAGLIGSNTIPGKVGPSAISPTGGLPQQNAINTQPGRNTTKGQGILTPSTAPGKDGKLGVAIQNQAGPAATNINGIQNQAGPAATNINGIQNQAGPAATNINGIQNQAGPAATNINGIQNQAGPAATNINGIQNQAGPAATNINGVARESIPIGILEAGLTNSTLVPPVIALPSGYPSSTVFAIGAISLIVFAIIVGPILCYLCKLKEKRDDKLRKQKAIKNRDVSENNIMESMVLHDFGEETASRSTNDAASRYGERYTTLDKDIDVIERFKKTGYLP